VLVAVLSSPHALEHDPTTLFGVIVVLGALVVAQQPVLNAELRWRRDAVLDPLTRLLNRQGLEGRFSRGGRAGAADRRPGLAGDVRSRRVQGMPAGLPVTASVGVSSAVGEEIELGPMFEAADRALYEAKRRGRNRVAYVPTLGSELALLAADVAPLGA
jgi:GGDEF domain-containing protein